MGDMVLSAPIAFAVLLAASALIYYALGGISYKRKGTLKGQLTPYACGEEQAVDQGIPDYGQFFPFALFFTILHVVALTVATVPSVTAGNFVIAVFYVGSALMGLAVLYRS